MKIAFITAVNSKHPGGVDTLLRELSSALVNKGIEVGIYGTDDSTLPSYQKVFTTSKFSLLYGESGIISRFDKEIELETLIKELNEYDICHFHSIQTPFAIWKLATQINCKKVAHFHSGWNRNTMPDYFSNIFKLFRKKYDSLFDASIFVSDRNYECYKNVLNNNSYYAIIPNGLNTEPFKVTDRQFEKEIYNVLYLGRFIKGKNPIHLINSAEALISQGVQNIKFTVVGHGEQSSLIEALIIEKDLSEYVNFIGPVSYNDRVKYFREADIFCAPYEIEAFGITYLEAMASGVPIISYRNPGLDYILKGTELSELIVLENNDTENMSARISELINDPRERKIISEREVSHVRKFDWKLIINEYIELYQELIDQK